MRRKLPETIKREEIEKRIKDLEENLYLFTDIKLVKFRRMIREYKNCLRNYNEGRELILYIDNMIQF